MSIKKQKKGPNVALDWRAVWEELGSTSDRGAAIVGEAILDQSLSVLLSNYLVKDQAEIDDLLDHRGPLSTLHSKSALAYCLGLITRGQLRDLRAINTIRNHFAHKLRTASFSDQSIKQVIGQIEPYKRFLTSEDADSPRKQFNAAVGTPAYSLSVESARVEHRQEKKARNISELLRELGSSQFMRLSAA